MELISISLFCDETNLVKSNIGSPFDIVNAKREVGNFNLNKLKNFSWFKNQLYFFNEKGEISHLKAEK